MKAAIAERAHELGFDLCRFTSADPPSHALRFQSWLAAGRHGEMDYLKRNAHKRLDPRQVLADARSIICLAASYQATSASSGSSSTGHEHPPDARTVAEGSAPRPARGMIARYARYRDYHDVLGERLEVLARFVDQCAGNGTRSLWYVDTGPVLERDIAQRAGIGFIGKHTNLISRKLGNWFLLAEILTTLELEPDAPERNRCGTCVRCLEACPTQAITGPFQVDARLCISYLTIELKGSIPPALRPAIGNRIFGCDDCLAVCPWNRFARDGRLMQAHARADCELPELVELLSLDEAAFRRRFTNTPMMRAKRRGLLRNVCVALGNIGDASVLPALQRAQSDPEPLVIEHARWAVEQIETRG